MQEKQKPEVLPPISYAVVSALGWLDKDGFKFTSPFDSNLWQSTSYDEARQLAQKVIPRATVVMLIGGRKEELPDFSKFSKALTEHAQRMKPFRVTNAKSAREKMIGLGKSEL